MRVIANGTSTAGGRDHGLDDGGRSVRRPRLGAALAVGLVVAAALAGAPTAADDDDHERARAAVEAGEILALEEILARVGAEFEGRTLEVELEREHGTWIYEVKLLTPQGNVLELEIDARSAEVLKIEGRGADAARRR